MTTVLILFFAAIILILAEFFVPGGVLGVLGVALLIGSMALGFVQAPEYAIFIVIGEVVGLIVSIFLGLYIMSKTGVRKLMVLESEQNKDAGYHSPRADTELVGKVATAHTYLRPAGTIMLDNERIDAVANGTFIEQGSDVRIIEVEGHRVVVEKARPEESAGEVG